MKKQLLFFYLMSFGAYLSWGQTFTWNPEFFNVDDSATLTVSNFDPQAEWGVADIYLWAWHWQADDTQVNNPTATGTDFNNSPATAQFTNNGDGTYTFDFGVIQDFFNSTDVARIGFLIKSQDGSSQGGDQQKTVGTFQIELIQPAQNNSLVDSGTSISIEATASVSADFELFANGTSVDTQSNLTSYSTAYVVNENTSFILEATQNGETQTEVFQVTVIPTVTQEAIPSNVEDGINYIDDTTAILVVTAPGKEFIEVAASWNNYNPTISDVMKQDPTTEKFWLEITGLTAGQIETYQYWVYDTDPIPGSPSLVKTADPFSTLVLSPFDDPGIPTSTYPNLPTYPTGQEREVTVLQTGQTPYPWQVTDFEKPKKEDLIVYEVLVRDFDADRNYQDLIDKIDYFKNLNINAIHLMPVMEFEGNESWGYNTSFHMALDKFYGTENKLKEFIDVCHQNGIAIILDVVLNHAFGRNPMVRMWMDDPDGDGWGGPATDSPYFNQFPTHSFNVGNDFNHQQPLVQEYTRRVIKHWIEEFNIDGFRWDLTKGFTQNCGNGTFDGDFNCTQQLQQDRIDVLKEYADYSWSLDDTHYVIFEHLGSDTEEQQWANYRIDEDKGIMLWGKMTDEYNELTMGQNGNKNITRMGHLSRGFTAPRLMGYPESHDEERLMYKNVEFGNSSNSEHDVTDLNTALSRMKALGAVSVMVPGPKMIWHFGDLGMDNSIFTCTGGNVNLPGGSDGDCKLDTKPQPQWDENWLGDPLRRDIYDTWARLHQIKVDEAVFEGNYSISSNSNNYTPAIEVWDDNLPNSEVNRVYIVANFDVTPQNTTINFETTGTWYSAFENNTPFEVTNTSTTIELEPGTFKMLSNQPIIDPKDLDSDGVPNEDDLCADTPLGAIVDVDGCEVFSLPTDNFLLQIESETCRSSNDGSFTLTAIEDLDYTITVSGNGVSIQESFTTSFTAEDLEAGTYEVCVTVANQPDYEQCFNVVITEPEDLSVLSRVSTTGRVSVELSGSSTYYVTLNGTTTQTTDDTISLDLIPGENSLVIKGDSDCQGIYEESIFFGDNAFVYPNPVGNTLNVYLGSGQTEKSVYLYSILGELVYTSSTNNNSLTIDTSSLRSGVYLLNIASSKENKSLKIVKE